MNSARLVSSVSAVRRPWRQFQRRQVTATSSRHTTSPGLGGPSGPSKASSPVAITSRGEPTRRSASSPPTGTMYFTLIAL